MDKWDIPTALPPLSRTLEPVRAPKFTVYRNGDPFFTGRQVVLRKPQHNMEVMLDYITDAMRPFGAVQRLYTPHTGTRVRSLDQIQDGASYVAAPKEGFKKMNYSGIMSLRQREREYRRRAAMSPQRASPVKLRPRRSFMMSEKPKLVNFVRNGDASGKTHRLLLTKRNTMTWDQVCQNISDKVRMEAPVRKLYKMTGEQVTNPRDLEHGETYVAVARIPFRNMTYTPAPPLRSPPRKKALPPISHRAVRVRARPRPRPPQDMPPAAGPTRHRPRPPQVSRVVAPRALRRAAAARHHRAVRADEEDADGRMDNGGLDDDRSGGGRGKAQKPTASKHVRDEARARPLGEDDGRSFKTSVVAQAPKRSHVLPPPPAVAPQSYIVTVRTPDVYGAGTDARVAIRLMGSEGDTGRQVIESDATHFQPGSEDVFAIEAPSVGVIHSIHIEHDNSGAASSWYCGTIEVRDTVADVVKYFHCNRWLADDRGDFSISARVDASDDDGAADAALQATLGLAPSPEREIGFDASVPAVEADAVDDSEETATDHAADMTRPEVVDDEEDMLQDDHEGVDGDLDVAVEDGNTAEPEVVDDEEDMAQDEDDSVDDRGGSDGVNDDMAKPDVVDDEERVAQTLGVDAEVVDDNEPRHEEVEEDEDVAEDIGVDKDDHEGADLEDGDVVEVIDGSGNEKADESYGDIGDGVLSDTGEHAQQAGEVMTMADTLEEPDGAAEDNEDKGDTIMGASIDAVEPESGDHNEVESPDAVAHTNLEEDSTHATDNPSEDGAADVSESAGADMGPNDKDDDVSVFSSAAPSEADATELTPTKEAVTEENSFANDTDGANEPSGLPAHIVEAAVVEEPDEPNETDLADVNEGADEDRVSSVGAAQDNYAIEPAFTGEPDDTHVEPERGGDESVLDNGHVLGDVDEADGDQTASEIGIAAALDGDGPSISGDDADGSDHNSAVDDSGQDSGDEPHGLPADDDDIAKGTDGETDAPLVTSADDTVDDAAATVSDSYDRDDSADTTRF